MMKFTRRLVLLSWVALVLIASAAFAADPSEETKLRALDAARIAALVKPDVSVLGEIFADDCVYVHSSGRVQSKAEYLALIANRTLRYLAMRYEVAPRVRLFGDATAIIDGTILLESQPPTGPAIPRTLVVVATYVKRGVRWQLVSYQSTNLAPATVAPAPPRS